MSYKHIPFAVIALVIFAAAGAQAAVINASWNTAISGDWDDPTNWDSVDFPNNAIDTYDVTIDAAGAAYTVTLNTPVTVDNLTLNSADANVNYSASAITVLGTTDLLAGTYTLLGGTIDGGAWNQSGGTLAFGVSNSNIITNGASITGDLNFGISSGRVRIEGGTTFTGDANLTASSTILAINDTQTLDNKTVNMDGSSNTLSVSGSNTLTLGNNLLVRGRGQVTSDSIVTGLGILNNTGTIRADLNNQTLIVSPDELNNTGTIEAINGGDLNVYSAVTNNTGTISMIDGGALNVGNGSDAVTNDVGGLITVTDSTLSLAGNWTNTDGTITASNSTVNLGGGFATSDIGSFTRTGGTVNITSAWDNTGENFTFDTDTGDWIMNSTTITGGTLNQGALGEQLRFGVSNSNILNGGLTYVGDLNFDIASGRVRIEDGASFTGDVNFSANSAFLVFNDTHVLDNRTVNMDGSSNTLSISGSNTLTLGNNMLVRGRGSVTSDSIVTGLGILNNTGTIRADLNNQTLIVSPDELNNTGTIEAINGGDLNITGPLSNNSGTISVIDGGVLVIGNGSDAATNAAGGVITATDSSMFLGGNWSNTDGTITASNSTVNLGGSFATSDIGTFTRTGGTVRIIGGWDNTGDSFTFDTDSGDWIMDVATITGGMLNQGIGGEGLRFGVSNSNILNGGLAYVGDLNFDISSGRVRIENGAAFTGDVNYTASSAILIFNDTQSLDNKAVNMDGISSTISVSGNNTLTLGGNMLVRGRGQVTSDTVINGLGVLNNNGTIRADINNQPLTVDPDELSNSGTIEAINGGDIRFDPTALTNLTGATLTGGTWRVADGGLFDFDAGSIETNEAELILEGVGSVFTVISSTPIEDVLTTNASAGVLRVIGNRDYPGTTVFTNAGDLELGGGTFIATSFDNQAGGELFGFGTVVPQVSSTGTVRSSGGTLTLAGGLNGTGSTVIIEAGSTLDFDGSDFIDTGAAFTLTDGRLEDAANIDIGVDLDQSGGTLAPGGSVGTTQLVGAYDLTGGNLETQFGGAGNPIDLLETTGNIDIALTGTSLLLRPVDAMAMGTYTLLRTTGGTLTGAFENVTDLGIYDDLIGIQYSATEVTLTLDRDLLVGDLNFDGFVGIADLNIVLGSWNQDVAPGIWPLGDPSGDGFIGIDDLNAVLGNWNAGTPPTVASTIPEPGSLFILGGLALGLCRRAG